MKKGKDMNKRKIQNLKSLALVLVLGLSLNVKAQVFISEGDYNDNTRGGMSESEFNVMVGMQDFDGEQYIEFSPLGNGVLLLTALGGVYLLKKRRKK